MIYKGPLACVDVLDCKPSSPWTIGPEALRCHLFSHMHVHEAVEEHAEQKEIDSRKRVVHQR